MRFFLDLIFVALGGFFWNTNFAFIRKIARSDGFQEGAKLGAWFHFWHAFEGLFLLKNVVEVFYIAVALIVGSVDFDKVVLTLTLSIAVSYFIWGPFFYAKSHLWRYGRWPDEPLKKEKTE